MILAVALGLAVVVAVAALLRARALSRQVAELHSRADGAEAKVAAGLEREVASGGTSRRVGGRADRHGDVPPGAAGASGSGWSRSCGTRPVRSTGSTASSWCCGLDLANAQEAAREADAAAVAAVAAGRRDPRRPRRRPHRCRGAPHRARRAEGRTRTALGRRAPRGRAPPGRRPVVARAHPHRAHLASERRPRSVRSGTVRDRTTTPPAWPSRSRPPPFARRSGR